ncbi:unnamed protein product [Allacma fusca]|uniref:Uncharacterized protein n=1 Tax=Allacma fusca TaxID=39272 RepID=A0A8J2NL59_9HEXA|nr:unnamed protein product [Allacma fusca]
MRLADRQLTLWSHLHFYCRFCPDPYNPFNASNVDKYVVGDDYQPIWLTRLGKHYSEGYSMKNSFDAYLQSIGKEPETIWTQVDDAIRSVILDKEPSLIQSGRRFKKGKFFEMMRFDFVIDQDLNVFLMEANMSPNLSSKHFPPNQQLYEQVLFALFSTIGLAYGPMITSEAKVLEITDRQKMTNAQHCGTSECMGCSDDCLMCSQCLSEKDGDNIRASITEHFNRVNTRRVFPPAGKETLKHYDSSGLTAANKMLVKWFYHKCVDDPYFCY